MQAYYMPLSILKIGLIMPVYYNFCTFHLKIANSDVNNLRKGPNELRNWHLQCLHLIEVQELYLVAWLMCCFIVEPSNLLVVTSGDLGHSLQH